MKMCGKGEMWSLHYHHDGNVMRDQVTPQVPVLLLILLLLLLLLLLLVFISLFIYLRILQAG